MIMPEDRRNLVISAVGDKSAHESWLGCQRTYDVFLVYYGDDDSVFDRYAKGCEMAVRGKGEKGFLYYDFVSSHLERVKRYDRIWQPDDDIESSCHDINSLFSIHERFGLWMSQPAIEGFFSHKICLKEENCLLRYTNFVEIMCPMFSMEQFLQLYHTWNLNVSSWGLDFLWPKLLGYPKDKIAIVDAVSVRHTNPPGSGRGRYPRCPHMDWRELMEKYRVIPSHVVYSRVPA